MVDDATGVTGVPQIVSDIFWGGLWGVLFALISDKVPGENLTVKGLIFGIAGRQSSASSFCSL